MGDKMRSCNMLFCRLHITITITIIVVTCSGPYMTGPINHQSWKGSQGPILYLWMTIVSWQMLDEGESLCVHYYIHQSQTDTFKAMVSWRWPCLTSVDHRTKQIMNVREIYGKRRRTLGDKKVSMYFLPVQRTSVFGTDLVDKIF